MYENVNIARDGLALEMLGPCGIWVVTFWLHGWKTRYVYMMFPYVPIKSSMDVTGKFREIPGNFPCLIATDPWTPTPLSTHCFG